MCTNSRLERVWRGLKSQPEEFAQYISTFKKSTFKKVIKETVSPDLISSIFNVLRDHSPSVKATLSALEGLAGIEFFPLFLSLLPQQDNECLKSIFASVANDGKSTKSNARIDKLKELYNIY